MSEEFFAYEGIGVAVLLILYAGFGLLTEKKKPFIGHEASLVIIIGMIFSYIGYLNEREEFMTALSFSPDLFFYFCLPPIVFASGFNMRRKTFFENFTCILMFGLVSTVLQFFMFSTLTYFY